MATADIETVVVGAGVVGLATAAALAKAGQDTIVLERDKYIGQGISSRNSEVIHAGIYYTPDSLKAKLCVQGKNLLYDYCKERNIAYKKTGKLIVATEDSEIETLDKLLQKGSANGVHDLKKISAKEAMAMQSGLRCIAAVLSPSTGIIDSHSLMLSLQADIESHAGTVVCHTEVRGIEHGDNLFTVTMADGTTVSTRNVVNCSGLQSVSLANTISTSDKLSTPTARYAKGNYFKLAAPAPFTRLIYPAPVVGGLGIHLTIDLAGQKRFGPDVEWLSDESSNTFDYRVDAARCKNFYTAIRKYWPDLPDNSLVPDYAGVRPKIEWPDKRDVDFEISTEQQHGIPGLVNLFGIESPGLTASLAIAEHIRNTLNQNSAQGADT